MSDFPETSAIAERVGQPVVFIPPGPFLMGTDPAVDHTEPSKIRFELPQHLVTLKGYYIGRFAVTNAAYGRFLEAGGYQNPNYWLENEWKIKETASWQQPARWDMPGWNGPDQPVAGIHTYEVLAYCRWLSQVSGLSVRLPTEAEWEKAARGSDGRLFPWGNEPPCSDLCTFGLDYRSGHPSPVGLHSPQGDSPYGCADMAGNVCEWTGSRFFRYPYLTDGSREKDAWTRIRRGGSYSLRAHAVRCASRSGGEIVQRELDGTVIRWRDAGFRVVVEHDEKILGASTAESRARETG